MLYVLLWVYYVLKFDYLLICHYQYMQNYWNSSAWTKSRVNFVKLSRHNHTTRMITYPNLPNTYNEYYKRMAKFVNKYCNIYEFQVIFKRTHAYIPSNMALYTMVIRANIKFKVLCNTLLEKIELLITSAKIWNTFFCNWSTSKLYNPRVGLGILL